MSWSSLSSGLTSMTPMPRSSNTCGRCQLLGHTREQCAAHNPGNPAATAHALGAQGGGCPHPPMRELMASRAPGMLPSYSSLGPSDSASQVGGSLLDQLLPRPGSFQPAANPRAQLIQELRAKPDFAFADEAMLGAAADALLESRRQEAAANLSKLIPGLTPATATPSPHASSPGPPHMVFGAHPSGNPPPPRPKTLVEGIEIGRGQLHMTDEWHSYQPIPLTAAIVQPLLTSSGAGTLVDLHHLDIKLSTPSVMPAGQEYEVRFCISETNGPAPPDSAAFNALTGRKFSRTSVDARTPVTVVFGDHPLATRPLYLYTCIQASGTGHTRAVAPPAGHITASVGTHVA